MSAPTYTVTILTRCLEGLPLARAERIQRILLREFAIETGRSPETHDPLLIKQVREQVAAGDVRFVRDADSRGTAA